MSGAEDRSIEERDVSVGTFVAQKTVYYEPIFERIQRGALPRWNMNIWGLIAPWLWAAWFG